MPWLELNTTGAVESLLAKLGSDTPPSLVLLEVIVSGQFTFEAIRDIRRQDESLPILMVSRQSELACAEKCLVAGANGYLNVVTSLTLLPEAVKRVLTGELYVSQEMQNRLFTGRSIHDGVIGSLTNRELDVFQQLGRGRSTREIGELLELSVKTIETYREKLKRKLELQSTHELLRYALESNVFRFEAPHPSKGPNGPTHQE